MTRAYPQPQQPPTISPPGWYIDPDHPDVMLWWTGSEWRDADKPLKPELPWLGHFLLFAVYVAVWYFTVPFLVGIVLTAFALRMTGRRARDTFMLLIPVWGIVVLVQTLWRLSALQIYWRPRPEIRSKPLFGPSVLPAHLNPSTASTPPPPGPDWTYR